jgi:hypothetical protein
MLRHNRAQTYFENKKHKERDKNHVSKPKVWSRRRDIDLIRIHTTKKYNFNLRDYLKSWGI